MDASPTSASRPDLRRSVFLPLAGMVMLLFLALGLVALWNEKRDELNRFEREVDAASRLFDLRLATDVETMSVAMEPMVTDQAMLERFLAGDREGLLRNVEGRFDALRAEHGITHMYFVGADRVTFLRVHQPERRGDVIDRFTMREAQHTGAPAHGLELGPLGTLTLRVVMPLRYEGRVVGYFELGREVEHYAQDIRDTLDTELRVLIHKDLLVREQWEEGQEMLGRPASWERFDAFVAAGSTAGEELGETFDEVMPVISQTESEPVQVALPNGRHVAIGARPLRDKGQREVGLLVISLDVTAAVLDFRRTLLWFVLVFVAFAGTKVLLLHRIVNRAAAGLRRVEELEAATKAELEQRVQERTAQLQAQIAGHEETAAQLQQAQKMEVIGQLTGGVAHDFNNLLAIIMGDLEYLRDRLADDEGLAEVVEGIWEAAERGAALVSRLLATSRKQPLSPRAVDVNELLAQLVPLLERAVPKQVVLRAEYEPQPWTCLVDPAQLENLILNLVVNARDAMPGGGDLTIATRNRHIEAGQAQAWSIEAGDYVELAVTDSGTGMAGEVLERAFDPFFTTKEVGKGSGLGLSMVQGTVKQSGGHVAIDSALGEGTTVTLLFPRA